MNKNVIIVKFVGLFSEINDIWMFPKAVYDDSETTKHKNLAEGDCPFRL